MTAQTSVGLAPSMLPTLPQVFPYQEICPGRPFSLGSGIPGTMTFPPTTPTRRSEKAETNRSSQSECTVTSSSMIPTMLPAAIRTPVSTGGTWPGTVTHAERKSTASLAEIRRRATACCVGSSPCRPTTMISRGRERPSRSERTQDVSAAGRRYEGTTTVTLSLALVSLKTISASDRS